MAFRTADTGMMSTHSFGCLGAVSTLSWDATQALDGALSQPSPPGGWQGRDGLGIVGGQVSVSLRKREIQDQIW